MLRKTFIATAVLTGLAIATPATASGWGGSTSSSGGCRKNCGTTTTTSTSGNTTTTSGGTKVPEPGMLGIAGVGLIGLGLIRRRRAQKA